jgi:glycosyltransferase involved in cell wall biosynthesis
MNMDGLEWKRNKYNAITRRFLKWAESIAARKPDRLIADSLAMQQHVLKTYGKKSAFIPYHATEFTDTDPTVVRKYNLEISNYCLVIARMEPENNIEMIIRGYIKSNTDLPLVLMGSIANKYGRRLVKKYARANIRFIGAIYDPHIVNNLRYYSSIYFHGHSVGGTNPSLLEAMACGCNIVSHDNEFNRGVLEEGGLYFSNEEELASIIQQPQNNAEIGRRRELNRSKIREVYNPVRILDAYEALLQAVLHQTAESNS